MPPGGYTPPTNTSTRPGAIGVPKGNPFKGHAMWIWEMSATNHGNVPRIIMQAKADRINTLIIKNGDGTTAWSQFNGSLVKRLHAAGLKVCAWQYVYGNNPVGEAKVGALAKQDGADCLVIDAESQYEGRYPSAQSYIKALRARIGGRFPVGLAGFPYIQYHTSFPYSVFLGAGGAQYNLPQMYWIDIGTSVPQIFQTTYTYNEIYRRPIFPLGQLYAGPTGAPSSGSIGQFNMIAASYGATGVSWWDFQSATREWLADTARAARASTRFHPATNAATIVRGNRGDLVIWAQEHLDGAGARLAVDGSFGRAMQVAVTAFQISHRLRASGRIDGRTWDALVKYTPVRTTWSTRKHALYSVVASAGKPLHAAVAVHVPRQAQAASAMHLPRQAQGAGRWAQAIS